MSDAGDVATKHCLNCKRDIAASNFVTHEVHCKRNIVLCEQCSEPVPRSDLETHVKDVHAPVNCDLCGTAVERVNAEKHKTDECSRRPCTCEFCELTFPAENHADHVEYCGSRTEPCPRCGQYVKLRDHKQHDDSNCSLPAVPPPPQAGRSGDDFVCDAMDAYHLSHLNHLLCYDGDDAVPWTVHPHGIPGRFGQPGRPFQPGRPNQSRAFGTRNRFDRRDRFQPAAGGRTNDFVGRRPKVVNGSQHKSSFTSVANATEEGCHLLPCEFCFDSFPSEQLYQHQVNCGRHSLTPKPSDYGLNLLDDVGLLEPDHDSLHTDDAVTPQWLYDDSSSVGDTEVMLPCEFCEVLLPATQLAFHQSNCETARLLGAATPLIPPALPLHRQPPKPARRRLPAPSDDPTTPLSRASRHQGPPPSNAVPVTWGRGRGHLHQPLSQGREDVRSDTVLHGQSTLGGRDLQRPQ